MAGSGRRGCDDVALVCTEPGPDLGRATDVETGLAAATARAALLDTPVLIAGLAALDGLDVTARTLVGLGLVAPRLTRH